MADFTTEINEARSDIEEEGELCRYLKYADSSSSRPWEDTGQPRPILTFNVYVVFIPAGQPTEYRSQSTVGKGGYSGLMANNGFVPALKDRVMRGSEALSIKNIIATKINEQPILYQLAFDR